VKKLDVKGGKFDKGGNLNPEDTSLVMNGSSGEARKIREGEKGEGVQGMP